MDFLWISRKNEQEPNAELRVYFQQSLLVSFHLKTKTKNSSPLKYLKTLHFLGALCYLSSLTSATRHSTKNTKELNQRWRIQIRAVPLSLWFFVAFMLVVDDLNAISLRLLINYSTGFYITYCFILVCP